MTPKYDAASGIIAGELLKQQRGGNISGLFSNKRKQSHGRMRKKPQMIE
jgi:hypothetical protein